MTLHPGVVPTRKRSRCGGQGSCNPDHLSRDSCSLLTNTGPLSPPLRLTPAFSSECQGPHQTSKAQLIAPAPHPSVMLSFPPYLTAIFISLCSLFPPLKVPSQAAPSLPSPEPTFRQSSLENVCAARIFQTSVHPYMCFSPHHP